MIKKNIKTVKEASAKMAKIKQANQQLFFLFLLYGLSEYQNFCQISFSRSTEKLFVQITKL